VAAPVLETQLGASAAPVAPFVHDYVGYRYEGFEPGLHRAMPGRHLTLIISLDEPVHFSDLPGTGQAPGRFAAPVGGAHPGAYAITHQGREHGIALDLNPLGARALLGMPAAAITSTVVELDDLFGASGRRVRERLAEAPSWGHRWALLDRFLLAAADRHQDRAAALAPEVAQAWHLLDVHHGQVTVNQLAAEVGWSRRHLGERFRLELGVSPKVAGRIMRFERSRALLGSPGRAERPGLATVAAVAGYYDQAHLTREWQELAGCSPTRWLAEDLPSVQDDGLVAGPS
jgi:AraC-like DNA-binding protein